MQPRVVRFRFARGLAACNGPLTLPNLKKLSPKTLAALVEKEDVVLPFLETLELIPEPDGSPTEDFVVPEGFQDRQRRQQSEEQEAAKSQAVQASAWSVPRPQRAVMVVPPPGGVSIASVPPMPATRSRITWRPK